MNLNKEHSISSFTNKTGCKMKQEGKANLQVTKCISSRELHGYWEKYR